MASLVIDCFLWLSILSAGSLHDMLFPDLDPRVSPKV